MALYEYKGQQYDIETDDPVLAKSKILKYLETGEGESKPKSAQQAPVEGAGGAAFGVYRPQGRRPESQNRNRDENREMAVQTGRGVLSNAIGLPGMAVDVGNIAYGQAVKPAIDFVGSQISNPRMPRYSDLPPAVQSAGNLLGGAYNTIVRGQEFQPLPQVPKMEKLPGIGEYGMEFYNQFVPGPDPTNAAGQLAFTGGQIAGAPLANKAFQAAMATTKAIAKAPGVVKNAYTTGVNEATANPIFKETPTSAFTPLREKVYPNETAQPWMAGTQEQKLAGLADLEASQVSSDSLFKTPFQRLLKATAPKTREVDPISGKKVDVPLMPLEGRVGQAFVEDLTRNLINDPYRTMAGNFAGPLAGAAAGSLIPGVGTVLGGAAGLLASPQLWRGFDLYKLNKLAKAGNLQPGFAQELAATKAAAGMPETMPANPAAGANAQMRPIDQMINDVTTRLQAANFETTPDTKAVAYAARTNEYMEKAKLNGVPMSRKQAEELAARDVNKHYNDKRSAEQKVKDAERAAKEAAEKQARAEYEASPEGQAEISYKNEVNSQINSNPDLKKRLGRDKDNDHWEFQTEDYKRSLKDPAYFEQIKKEVADKKAADTKAAEEKRIADSLQKDTYLWNLYKDTLKTRPLDDRELHTINQIIKHRGEDPFGTGKFEDYSFEGRGTGNPNQLDLPLDPAGKTPNTDALARMSAEGKYRAPKTTAGSLFETPIGETPVSTPKPTSAEGFTSAAEYRKSLTDRGLNSYDIDQLVKKAFPEGETSVETPKRKYEKQADRVKAQEAERTKDMTPEELAADEKAIADRIANAANPNSKLNKAIKGGKMGMMTDDTSPYTTMKRHGTEKDPVSIEDARIAAYEHGIQQTPHIIWTEVDGVKYQIKDNGVWGKSVTKVNKDGTAVEYYGSKKEGYKRKEYDKDGNMKGVPKTSDTQFPDFPGDIIL